MPQISTDQLFTLIPVDPEALGRLMEECSERGARRALAQYEADGFLTSEQTAALLGYRRPDGSPNATAFKSFRQRNAKFQALATPFGHRLRWRRSDVERWMAEHRRPAAVSPTAPAAEVPPCPEG